VTHTGQMNARVDPEGSTFEGGPAAEAASIPRRIDWDQQEFKEVRPGILGATIHTPALTAVLYRYEPGSRWEEHSHAEDQMTFVLEGTMEFVVAGLRLELCRGQMAALPGGVPHSASVGPGAGAATLNVFTRRST
jgi:quercetin dioxygenase-like cupin family protein